MAFTGKVLASGQVADSLGTLYTVPGSTVAYVKKMTFVNTNAAAQTLLVYLRADGSNDRLIGRAVLAQDERYEIENTLAEAADLIRAVTTTASAVDYTIQGVEEA